MHDEGVGGVDLLFVAVTVTGGDPATSSPSCEGVMTLLAGETCDVGLEDTTGRRTRRGSGRVCR